jgi:hypothetical protein
MSSPTSGASRSECDTIGEPVARSARGPVANGARRALPQLLLMAASFGVALLAAEIVLRAVVGPPVYFRHPQEHYAPDPMLGHRLVPHQRAFTHDAPVAVNALGMRDREVTAATAPGLQRVLAIGDSQTFGNGLPLDATWPKQLGERLGAGVEVLNAGIPGTDTWQHDRWLAEIQRSLRFDLVVLGLYANDVVPLPQRIGSAVALSNDRAHRISYVVRRSAVATALWQAFGSLRAQLAPDPGAQREQAIVTGVEPAAAEAGWRQVEVSLREMQRTAREAGADLLVLLIPRRDQVSGRLGADGFQQRAASIAARLGIEVVDGRPPLRAAYGALGDRLFLPWDGHDSAAANRVLADALVAPVRGRLERAAQAHDAASTR